MLWATGRPLTRPVTGHGQPGRLHLYDGLVTVPTQRAVPLNSPHLMALPHAIEDPLMVRLIGKHLLIRQVPIHDVILGQREGSMRQGRDMDEESLPANGHMSHEQT